jgi:hypothetical protein
MKSGGFVRAHEPGARPSVNFVYQMFSPFPTPEVIAQLQGAQQHQRERVCNVFTGIDEG